MTDREIIEWARTFGDAHRPFGQDDIAERYRRLVGLAERGLAADDYVRENAVLRENCDNISSENQGLSSQVESMAMRIESLAHELAKPDDVRLREALDAIDGRAVVFDGLGARITSILDELDHWIERAGAAESGLAAEGRMCSAGLVKGGEVSNWSDLPSDAVFAEDEHGRPIPHTAQGFGEAEARGALPITWYRYEEP